MIKIIRNEQGNCINFEGSSNPTYWNACLSGEVDSEDANAVNVINDVITSETGVTEYEFYKIPFTEFSDKDGNVFADATEAAAYITAQANVIGLGGSGTDLNGVSLCFTLDDTSTSILLDNGYHYGVNAIQAIAHSDGTIHIVSVGGGDITHFYGLEVGNACIGTGVIAGGLNDVVNTLNELFTVGAFEAVVISDPHSTLVADVGGVDTTGGLVGDAINPSGNDIGAGVSAHYNKAGYKSTETIDQAGEYFTFNMRNEGIFGACLVLDDIADAQGNLAYADPTKFCDGTGNGNTGIQWGMFFHPSPNGPWTYYGALTGTVYGSGWNGADAFANSNDGANWLAGNAEEFRIGIDANSFISMEYYNNDTSLWVVVSRTNYPVGNNVKFHLGIKFCDSVVRLVDNPKVHLLEPAAPTMNFRYIESPDNNFEYPLFATEEEANFYDLNSGGTGTSHSHTYTDDPTSTTWYMADNQSTMTGTSVPSGAYLTFMSNAVTYTEITSLTDADLTPSAFSFSDISQEEGTAVNLQLYPAGATFSQSATISPNTSGLVYNTSSHYLQGTLADVGSDTVYTVTVIRANSYGSTTSTFTITATDVAPVQTNDTAWTKAIDFSGSTEYLKHNSSYADADKNPLFISNGTYIPNHSNSLYTANSSSSRPWATTIVFKADGNNSRQTIWNSGEGFYSSQDNFGLEIDSNNTLWFYWSNGAYSYSSANRCYVQIGIDTSKWYGVYIAHKGGRFSSANATAANLGEAFDIRVMSSADSFASISPNRSSANSGGNWQMTGRRMDKTINGGFTIGAAYNGAQPFYGKVASSVITTLKNNSTAPVEAEIKTMITDPIKWQNDYKQGTTYREANSSSTTSVPSAVSVDYNYATQIHLMGDSVGIYPYSHSDAYPTIFNNLRWVTATRMVMQNMVSNDIETVNINGLT